MIPGTTSAHLWDALVVGSGPAGISASIHLARAGKSVLVIDKQAFPRHKSCGGTLNANTVGQLHALGVDVSGIAVPLQHAHFSNDDRQVRFVMNRTYALSRCRLDAMLIESAKDAGVAFQDNTQALGGRPNDDGYIVRIRNAGVEREVGTRLLVLANGVAGGRAFGFTYKQATNRYLFGFSALIPETLHQFPSQLLQMTSREWGYYGMVTLEDGSLNLSGAFQHGIKKPLQYLLRDAGYDHLDNRALTQFATPPLHQHATRRLRPGVVLLGDAASYLEPFTGEGIRWALESSRTAAPYLERLCNNWDPLVAKRCEFAIRQRERVLQMPCKLVSYILRSERRTTIALRALPWLLNASRHVGEYLPHHLSPPEAA